MKKILIAGLCLLQLFVSIHPIATTPRRQLKILVVVKAFPYALQTFIINQIRGLRDRGHEISIWAEKVSDLQLPLDLASYDWNNRIFYKMLPHEHRQYDIILCQFADLAYQCIALKKEGLRGKLVVSYRGSDIKNSAVMDIFEAADLITPVCQAFKNTLIIKGCPADKIVVVHSVINCSRFLFKQCLPVKQGEPIKIISVGRLVKKKGLNLAIKAIALVVRKYKNIEYQIIGDGNLRSELEALAKRCNLEKHIKFLGRRNPDEVAQYLVQSHIFLLPSMGLKKNVEGIPNVLKEAMATGLPVISTRHSGIPELITDGVEGFLVQENDVGALAHRLEYLITHQERWLCMGSAGRAKIEQEYEMERENDRLEQLLLSM